ncbi:MAG: hypothetical protein JSW52_10360 [Candidatus Coatesbacteria bacterium]|nr:MAG: hypothetical protein JSW52_10360 [Candidatus Coatesbacteria bacterium]
MRTLCVLLTLAFAFPVSATDWYILDSWDVPEVPGNPDNPTDYSHAFGLAYRDSEIYVGHFNSEDLYPGPPFETNLWVYDMSGNYQGKHFPSDITDIDTGCVDWKEDADHGGTGWYMSDRRGVGVYFVADNGSSYTYFAAPPNFTERTYGVAHNPDDDMLYVSNWITSWFGYGSLDGSGHVTSWTQEDPGFRYNALKYVSVGGTDYLLAQDRGDLDSWDNSLHIFILDGSGVPNIYVPDVVIDYNEGGQLIYYPGDISWDGDNFWMLDQNKLAEDGSDWPTKIALPDLSSYTVNITPASLGNIKAQFR